MGKFVLFTSVAVVLLMGCGGGGNMPSELVGQWEHASGATNKKPENIELFKDGTGVVDGSISVTWKVENKRLALLSPLSALSCNYKVSGYELTLAYDDEDSAIFVRKGKLEEFKAKQAAAAAAAEAEKTKQIAEAKRALEKLPNFTDSRDGKVYRKVAIGKQTWMAENLNYAAEFSRCYKDKAGNCEKYGRLYSWVTAKRACPAGWHLPSDAEWTALVEYAGGEDIAGTKLKSKTGWDSDSDVPAGKNEYGFSALPGGGYGEGNFQGADSVGVWWSATGNNASNAWLRIMKYDDEVVDRQNDDSGSSLLSVRCVQD